MTQSCTQASRLNYYSCDNKRICMHNNQQEAEVVAAAAPLRVFKLLLILGTKGHRVLKMPLLLQLLEPDNHRSICTRTSPRSYGCIFTCGSRNWTRGRRWTQEFRNHFRTNIVKHQIDHASSSGLDKIILMQQHTDGPESM